MDITKLTENIYRLKIPFANIHTSVFVFKTDTGALLFDAATYGTDVTDYIIPFLSELNIGKDELKYAFISHPHGDHAGGLSELCRQFPDLCVANSGGLTGCELHGCKILKTKDSDTLLGYLKVVHIPGHTADSSGILDTRTGTLISGDSLQLYGVFGEGPWAVNITLIDEYFAALERVRALDISEIYPAHSYHPIGEAFVGREMINAALDECKNAIFTIEGMIKSYPSKTDKEIAVAFCDGGKRPSLLSSVVTAVRARLIKNG